MKKYQDNINLKIPVKLRYLPFVLDSTKAFAKIVGFDEKQTNEILLGIEEAVVNVIEHAFTISDDAVFELVLQETALGMKIQIKEQGMPFDPAELVKLGQKEIIEAEGASCLGLHLMYRFMDEVSFVNLGKSGKETCLIKYLGKTPEVEKPDFDEIRESAKNPAVLPSYQIRQMLPHEAVEVSKCAYMSYGYTYSNEHIYFPERLRKMNETGEMVSFVAVSSENEIIGHTAVLFEGADRLVASIDDAFVKPEYRGTGCLNKLAVAVFDWFDANNITGTYVWAVTSHVYSQKESFKFGFRDTAICISSELPLKFKGIEEEAGQRESCIILFQYLGETDTVEIYAPLHHRDILTEIYKSLGVKTEIISDNTLNEMPEEETVLELKYDPCTNAFMTIRKYGRNVIHDVSCMLKDLCLEKIETIFLFLPLNNTYTAQLTSDFEKMGFFFSGIMPGSNGRDRLILQYLNNQRIDYEKIHINSDTGKKILEYIKKRDPSQAVQSR